MHLLEVGAGEIPGQPADLAATSTEEAIEITLGSWTFFLESQAPFEINAQQRIQGDVNADGKANIFDLLGLLKVLAGIENDADYVQRSDITGDGKANIFDLLELLKLLAGD